MLNSPFIMEDKGRYMSADNTSHQGTPNKQPLRQQPELNFWQIFNMCFGFWGSIWFCTSKR